MALIDLWKSNREELEGKLLQQLIAIAGEGRLLDGNSTSIEFRELLRAIPASQLGHYAQQCLDTKFDGSGFALQDIVNQVAIRLGFSVEHGRYRGMPGQYGHDGLWTLGNGHKIVVEVKTTDAYAINLDIVAAYRKKLIADGKSTVDNTSLLLIVGRHDTGGLEAQIRGSRYAWDMRIISVDALIKLLELKETLDDPSIVARVQDVLIPQEYTKLDAIIDLAFMTVEEVASADAVEVEEDSEDLNETADVPESKEKRFKPSGFHDLCANRLESHLGISLVKQSRSIYSTPSGDVSAWVPVSKQHGTNEKEVYWFAFHPHQKDTLVHAEQAYFALGCASASLVFVIPFTYIREYLNKMWTTVRDDRMYWHVKIEGRDGKYTLLLRQGEENPDISSFLLESENSISSTH